MGLIERKGGQQSSRPRISLDDLEAVLGIGDLCNELFSARRTPRRFYSVNKLSRAEHDESPDCGLDPHCLRLTAICWVSS